MPIGDAYNTPSLFEVIEDATFGMKETVLTKIPPEKVYSLINGDLTEAGVIKKCKGLAQFGSTLDSSALVRALEFFAPAGGTPVMLVVQNGKIWTINSAGTTATIATGLTDEHKGITIGNNKAFVHGRTDNVRYYDGSLVTTFGNTNTDPPRAKHGIWILNWLLLANDTTNPDGIYYGDNGAPTTGWDRTANVLKINQGDGGEILGLLPWNDFDFIVLKTNRIFRVTISSADPSEWPVNAITEDIGVINGAAVVVGDTLVFLAEDGIRTVQLSEQGITLANRAPISQGEIDQTIARIRQSVAVSTAVMDQWNGVIRLAVPFDIADQNDGLIEFNLAKSAFQIREDFNIGRFAKSRFSNVTDMKCSDSRSTTPKVYKFDSTFNNDGSAITWSVEFRGMDFGDKTAWKIGGELELVFNPSGDYDIDVQIRTDQGQYSSVGTVNLSGGGPNLPVNLPFYLGETLVRTEPKISLFGVGRFRDMQMKLTTSDLGAEVEFIRAIFRTYPQEYSMVR